MRATTLPSLDFQGTIIPFYYTVDGPAVPVHDVAKALIQRDVDVADAALTHTVVPLVDGIGTPMVTIRGIEAVYGNSRLGKRLAYLLRTLYQSTVQHDGDSEHVTAAPTDATETTSTAQESDTHAILELIDGLTNSIKLAGRRMDMLEAAIRAHERASWKHN